MGCWNGTCGLTGLPIFHGDPVVAMVIQRQRCAHEETTPSYAWDLWAPATLMVVSKYDDYGGIELTESIIETLRMSIDHASQTMD